MTDQPQSQQDTGCGCLVYVLLILAGIGYILETYPGTPNWIVSSLFIGSVLLPTTFIIYGRWVKYKGEKNQEELQRQEIANQEEERERRIEEILQRDELLDRVHYMSGLEFEQFMAELFSRQGYGVQLTSSSGDQGTDLLVDIDERTVAVQLKRWTQPVGNAAVQATFTGMFVYGAEEAWLITTSSFTKSAVEAAKKTNVRLIDGKELRDWMESLKDEP